MGSVRRRDEQRMFDTVARHLLTQRRQSRARLEYGPPSDKVGYFGCAYRAPNGDRCAVGALIPDAEYLPGMERRAVRSLIEEFPQLRRHIPSQPLAAALQKVHDQWPPLRWLEQLSLVAEKFKLSTKVLYLPPPCETDEEAAARRCAKQAIDKAQRQGKVHIDGTLVGYLRGMKAAQEEAIE